MKSGHFKNPRQNVRSDPATAVCFPRASGEEWFVRLPGGLLVSCGVFAPTMEIQGGPREVAEWLCECINEWRREQAVMPWCALCQSYHHPDAGHIIPPPKEGDPP